MPAREDFLGNLVFSSYYKDASPVRIASRVFSFVDSVSASLTSCKTRAAFPRGKNRLVELGARAGITVLAARAPTWNNSQWAGKYAVICSPPSNGLGWVQRSGTGQWPIKLTLGRVVLSARWWRTLIQTGGSGSIPRSALRTPHLKSEPPHVGCYGSGAQRVEFCFEERPHTTLIGNTFGNHSKTIMGLKPGTTRRWSPATSAAVVR